MWTNILLIGVVIIELVILIIVVMAKKMSIIIRLLHILTHSLILVSFPLALLIDSNLLINLSLLAHFILNLLIVITSKKRHNDRQFKRDLIAIVSIVIATFISILFEWKYTYLLYYVHFFTGLLISRDDLFVD